MTDTSSHARTLELTVDRAASFTDVADGWEALCRRLGRPPSDWPQWHRHWRDAFATHPIRYVTARRGDELVGLLAFEDTGGILTAPVHVLHSPALQPVHEDATVLTALLRAVVAARPRGLRWDELLLDATSGPRLRHALAPALPRQECVVAQRAPYIELSEGWEVLRQRVGRSFHKDLRRRRRRAESHGQLRHECVQDELPPSVLARCLAVEAAGWKGRQGTAIADHPTAAAFFRGIADWAATEGWLRIDLLWLGDELTAFEFNLHHAGVVHALKVGYDERFAEFSPGTMLSALVLERDSEDPSLHRADWGAGENPYKLRWAHGADELYRLRAYPPGPGGYVRSVTERTRRRARERIGGSLPPEVADRVRVTRARLRRLTDHADARATGGPR